MAYMGRFRVRGSHPLRRRFPAPSATAPLCRFGGPTTPRGALPHPRFGLLRVRSPLLAQSFLFSLPAGTKMFQFPALASSTWSRMYVLHTYRLSHSEIPGSRVICTYPGLIAAYHVLHRLHEPRHPPCALYYFRFPAKRPDAHTFSCSCESCLAKLLQLILLFSCALCQRSLSQNKGNVENIGVEPMTSCMPCKRSSQLS